MYAQTNPEDAGVAQAKARLEKLRDLVNAGVVPRAQLTRAEEDIADAEDAAVLRRTLYGQVTDEQADEMIAAADRRFARRQRAFDRAKQLVDVGAATQSTLDTLLQDLDFARKECDLVAERAQLVHELAAMADAERTAEQRMVATPHASHDVGERHDGDGIFTPATFAKVELAFEGHFGKPLPVSANGETDVHRALGFDHRGRVDVAIHPDQPEGVWLREYLDENHIPYFAFRAAVPGKATGAHIHLGPVSTSLAHGG
jgi:hypothetical protein